MTAYTPAVRDSFTQQVSVKIGITLDRFYTDLVHETGIPVNTLYREALSRFALDPCTHEEYLQKQAQASQNELRIRELEAELSHYRRTPLSPGIALPQEHQPAVIKTMVEPEDSPEEIQSAFADQRVMDTFVKLAHLIETHQIDHEQQVIVQHFTTLCPHVRVKRVLEAIYEVGYRVEHGQVDPQATPLLSLFLSFHPRTAHAISVV